MTINIDQAWLDARTPPYRLNASGETYVLSVDVTTDGCAFFIGASNVTLDLNGHTITYGNVSPISISNNSFEDSDLSAWNLTNAPSFSRQAASVGLHGSWCLKGTTAADEYVISPTITVPSLNQEYCAYSMGRSSRSGTGLILDICRASDMTVLGTTDHYSPPEGDEQPRGFSIYRRYVPSNLDDIKLKITFKPGGTSTVFMIDFVNLFYSRLVGIYAGGVVGETSSALYSSLGLNGAPAQLARLSFFNSETGKGRNFTLTDSTKSGITHGSGLIIQGASRGIQGYPVWVEQNLGTVTLDGVHIKARGPDTSNIHANYTYNLTVKGCEVESDIEVMSRRMSNLATIYGPYPKGIWTIEDNIITNSPQQGITLAEGDGTSGTSYIRRNSFVQRGIITEEYAIVIGHVQNIEIYNNTITVASGYSGRGILVDTAASPYDTPIENIWIYDNVATVREKVNLEYDRDGMQATALRIRAYSSKEIRNIYVYGNTFSSYTGASDDDVAQAIGCRISLQNTGLSDNSDIIITNNTFKGIAERASCTNGNFSARGLVLDEIGGSTWFEIRDGNIESNHIAMAFGSTDGFYATNQRYRIYSPTLVKSAEYTGLFTFRSYGMGTQCASGSTRPVEVFLLDMKYSGGATNDFAWETSYWGAGDTGSILTGWVYNVVGVLADADITVVDKDVVTWYTGVAGSDGCNAYVPALVNKKVKPKTGDEVVTVLTPLTVNYDVQSKTGLIPTANETLDFSEGESQVVLMLMS